MKPTALHRIATAPGFEDSTVIARALIAAAPECIIWGSDSPYLSNAHWVDSINIFNRVAQGMPDAATRQQILVDNPANLFRFIK